jgi:autonomous glycyl radical cofactor GrcA
MGLDSNCFIPDLTAMREANPRLVQAAAGAGIDLLVQQLYARGDNSIVFGELRTLDSREVPMEAAGLFSIYGGQHVTRG